ncbi:MAG: hypothetical protein IRY90_02755 [Actinomadura rubrobrunea]|nr:hypothetical protein [Actinomadura rubrobrunea]
MSLYDNAALAYREAGEQRHFQILRPDDGALLVNVTQVVGPQPKRGLKRFFSASPDRSRAVVRADAPDGTPLFFVDRAEGQEMSALEPPCAVVAPDGRLIGRVVHNAAAFAQSFLEGMRAVPGGRSTVQQAHRLLDAQDQPLCDVTWEPVQSGGHLETFIGGNHCVYTDANGTQLARFEGGVLRLAFQFPEPLRTLLIASPLAFALMTDL